MAKKKILITGATGFLGRAFLEALLREGYAVRAVARNPRRARRLFPHPDLEWIEGDFAKDHDPALWESRLEGVEGIVNTAGIIREKGGSLFESIHVLGPVALWKGARKRNITKIVQISALGSDESARTPYHITKRKADEFLRTEIPSSVVLRPSLIVGPGGESTSLFSLLASLPVTPLPGRGEFPIQPVALEDLICGVTALFRRWPARGAVLDVVGPEPITFRDWIAKIRGESGLPRAPRLVIPMAVMRTVARMGVGLLDSDTLTMLEQGSVSDAAPFRKVVGGPLRSPLLYWKEGAKEIRFAALPLLVPVLRLSIAFLWIFTGIISAFVYPPEKSYDLLRGVGLPDVPGFLFLSLYGASLLDAILGVGLFTRFRSLFYGVQILTVLFYTTLLGVASPEFWVHPFGPLSKNIPLLGATLVAFVADQKRRRAG